MDVRVGNQGLGKDVVKVGRDEFEVGGQLLSEIMGWPKLLGLWTLGRKLIVSVLGMRTMRWG